MFFFTYTYAIVISLIKVTYGWLFESQLYQTKITEQSACNIHIQ